MYSMCTIILNKFQNIKYSEYGNTFPINYQMREYETTKIPTMDNNEH